MTLEKFQAIVVAKIKDYLPEGWKNAKIEHVNYLKNNHEKSAISFLKNDGSDWDIGANLSMEKWHEWYEEGERLEEILQGIAREVLEAEKGKDVVRESFNLQELTRDIHENVVLKLINTKQNEELLRDLPHREVHDMSVIYTWIRQHNEVGRMSCNITNHLAERYGLTEEELFEIALQNTKEILKPRVLSMEDTLASLGMLMEDGLAKGPAMQVLSNESGFYGASTILLTEYLDIVAERFDGDFYIIPSSIHECIAIPVGFMEPEEIQEMVYTINMSSVEIEDRLSNEVYHYDRESKTISMATDCPNKSLSDLPEEPALAFCVAEQRR